jgi:hypothetical protein
MGNLSLLTAVAELYAVTVPIFYIRKLAEKVDWDAS